MTTQLSSMEIVHDLTYEQFSKIPNVYHKQKLHKVKNHFKGFTNFPSRELNFNFLLINVSTIIFKYKKDFRLLYSNFHACRSYESRESSYNLRRPQKSSVFLTILRIVKEKWKIASNFYGLFRTSWYHVRTLITCERTFHGMITGSAKGIVTILY